ncbi:MAG: hypothetical protein ACSHXH_06280 [Marivita sp.]|uniref:hypothetical protein n=1 Tax=Marivita sp. TaxID=2003365 RepID=UPI003EFA39A5
MLLSFKSNAHDASIPQHDANGFSQNRMFRTPRRRSKEAGAERNNVMLTGIFLSGSVMIVTAALFLGAKWHFFAALGYALLLQICVLVWVFFSTRLFRSIATRQLTPRKDRTTPELKTEIRNVWFSYVDQPNTDTSLQIACAAPNTAHTRRICTELADLGHELHHNTQTEAIFDSVINRSDAWNFVIVDLDLFEEAETAVDDLFAFRATCPGIPVLLISSGVGQDDLSRERNPISDGILRKPVFRKRLIEGIASAQENSMLRFEETPKQRIHSIGR